VQGDQSRFGAKANEREKENGIAHDRVQRWGTGSQRREIKRSAVAKQKQEGNEQEAGADVGHHEIDERGATALLMMPGAENEEEGDERHQLPCQEKGEDPIRQHDEAHRCQKCRQQRIGPRTG
jgi:hypothetical protein